jgi:hypothetical protein
MLAWKLKPAADGTVVAPDERPPWPQTTAIGLQHVVAMFGATGCAARRLVGPCLALLLAVRRARGGPAGRRRPAAAQRAGRQRRRVPTRRHLDPVADHRRRRQPLSQLGAAHPILRQRTSAFAVLTAVPTQYVRVFTQGTTNAVGGFIAPSSAIRGLSATQVRDVLALPFLPDSTTVVQVPAGTCIIFGTAAPITGSFPANPPAIPTAARGATAVPPRPCWSA